MDRHQIRRIVTSISPRHRVNVRCLLRGIQDIASTYQRMRCQPAPSKSEARFELEMLVHQVWRLEQETTNKEAAITDLRRLIGGMNDLARCGLWGGLERHPRYDGPDFYTYSGRPDVEWRVLGEAATVGLSLLRGGDYPDTTASIAVQDLIALYRVVTHQLPTFSRRSVGPGTAGGNDREVGNSPCFRFVAAFFREMNDDVSASWLTGKVQALLHPRSNAGSR